MPHGQARDPRKEQFWREVVRRWPDSGLTIRAYCRRQRLSEASFYAWRRELAQRDEPAQPAADAAAVTFAPLTVHAAAFGPAELPVEVVLANGRRLRVPVGVAAGVVRDLLAVLEETPC
jgi:Transposase